MTQKVVQSRAAYEPDRLPTLSFDRLRTGQETTDGAAHGALRAACIHAAQHVTTASPVEDQLDWLCQAAVADTEVSCCGVTMVTRGGQSITAHASDDRAKAVEDLQHTLGEGPGVAASASGAAVLVPDLRDGGDHTLARWPVFARDAVQLGILAAFAFPLLIGSSRIGALNLYRIAPGGLTSRQLSQGLVAADSVAMTLAENGDGLPTRVDAMDPMRVHQAAGMAMVQLGLPIDEALLRMRAIAFAEGQSVDELADAILHRRRRLSEEDS